MRTASDPSFDAPRERNDRAAKEGPSTHARIRAVLDEREEEALDVHVAREWNPWDEEIESSMWERLHDAIAEGAFEEAERCRRTFGWTEAELRNVALDIAREHMTAGRFRMAQFVMDTLQFPAELRTEAALSASYDLLGSASRRAEAAGLSPAEARARATSIAARFGVSMEEMVREVRRFDGLDAA